jgi:D-lactate dehydrogenase (quinone)
VDGPAHCIDASAAAVAAAAHQPGLLSLRQAATAEEVAQLWRTRNALSPALRNIAPKKINEDVVVPVSRIPELIDGLQAIALQSGIRIVNFGHAGNGNIHVNLLLDPAQPGAQERAAAALEAAFDLVLALGGTLSGEHGVGLEKRDYVGRELGPEVLALLHGIKAQFDPAGILNPGKAFPPLLP